MYCTLWEECKQTQCLHEVEGKGPEFWCDITVQQKTSKYIKLERILMILLSGQYGKYNSIILLFPPLGPFPLKMMRCPWILCFDHLPLQYTDLTHEIWRFLYFLCKTIILCAATVLQAYFTHLKSITFLGPGTTFSKIVKLKIIFIFESLIKYWFFHLDTNFESEHFRS